MPSAEFYQNNKKKYSENAKKYREKNKEKLDEYNKKYYTENVAGTLTSKKYNLQRYGLSFEDYESMILEQKGLCAICNQPETRTLNGNIVRLSVDHDHFTDQVRKLLCTRCNLLLGQANDDISILEMAIKYLKQFKEP